MNNNLKKRRILQALFFFSGVSALIYEILWSKYLSLIFGATIPAVSTIAATFMGGLALGSYIFGRYADRARNLLINYGLLELGIAISATIFPAGLHGVEIAYIAANKVLPGHPGISSLIRFLLSVSLLLLPTTFMGGTLPVMCRYFAGKRPSKEVGKLYGINTFGAASGTLIAAFLLIPIWGLTVATCIAIGINLFIALLSFGLADRKTLPPGSSESREKTTGPDLKPVGASTVLFVLICSGLTGFYALAYEILWTRVLLLYLGNTTYSFAIILSLILIGIALGGGLYAKAMKSIRNFELLFSAMILTLGLLVILSSPFYDRFSYLFYFANIAAQEHWWLIFFFAFLIASPLILLPTVVSGILLPTAVGLLRPGQLHTGEGVGTIVLVNTFGGIIGSLTIGFFLIPHLGLQKSFMLLSLSNVALGLTAFLFFRLGKRPMLLTALLGGLALVAILFAPPWDQKLMNAGVYYYSEIYREAGGIDAALANTKLLAIFEGTDTTVAVQEWGGAGLGTKTLSINGKIDASDQLDMTTQALLAQLPLLIHPNPRNALIIGLGSGITLGTAKEFTLDSGDCVEISPEVVKASRFFSKGNGDPLEDSKVRLHIQDGRNLLLLGEDKYDVIISEPSNPWQTGNANLFTLEFYQLARSRLFKNGIFCQWIPIYDMDTREIRTICRTFMSAFPQVMAFKGGGGDLLLLGSQAKMFFDYQSLKERMQTPGVAASLAAVNISSAAELIARHYLFSGPSLAKFAGSAPLNRDAFPRVEYSHTLGKIDRKNVDFKTRTALFQARQQEEFPLINAGSSRAEIASTYLDLSQASLKEGDRAAAAEFANQAEQYAP